MKYSLLSILLLLSASLHATHFSYTDGVVENGDFAAKRELQRGSNYIEVTYHFGGFSVEKTSIGGKYYHLVRMANTSVSEEKGFPELPVITDMLSVASASLKVEVKSSSYKEYKSFNVIPSRGPLIQSDRDSVVTLTFSDVYEKNAYYPAISANLQSVQSYRSYPFAYVSLSPIQYNPVNKSIRCYTDITYRISWSKNDYVSEAALPGDADMPMNYSKMPSLLKGLVSDYVPVGEADEAESLRSADVTASKEFADYIIVTTNKYLPAVQKLVSWKAMLGYKCKVLSAAWSTPSEVDQAIKTAYVANNKPEYLLIVGDISDVPSYMNDCLKDKYQVAYGSWASDLKYVCMDGDKDSTADMAKGRIPVSSLAEANIVVDKIIKYEKDPVVDDNFYNTALHCAEFQDDEELDGREDRRFVLTSEEIRNYMMGWGKTVNRVYVAPELSKGYLPQYYSSNYSTGAKLPSDLYGESPVWNGTTSDIVNYINEGASYVLHRDHGNYNGWGNPAFWKSNVATLVNGDKTPVVFSLNCLTGGFQQPECFCETFLRNGNGGAVGVVGATTVSYSGYNDAFAIGMFDAMFPNPGVSTVWMSGETYKPRDLEPIYNMGKVVDKGLLTMGKIYSNSSNRNYTKQIFHYFGDPSMELRTEVPACLDAKVEKKGTTVTVSTPVEDCRISLCSIDDAGETYVQSFEGVSEAVFDGIDFDYAVTVYKHNYVPYVYDSNSSSVVIAGDLTYIQNVTYKVDANVYGGSIVAGDSVTSDQENGAVLIKDVNVNYYASKSITLGSGFSVSVSNSDAKFVAQIKDMQIKPCEYAIEAPISVYDAIDLEEPEFDESATSENIDIVEVDMTAINSLAANGVNVYAENGEIVVSLGDVDANVVISDMSGKQLAFKQGMGNLKFSVGKGSYIVTVQLPGNQSSVKVVNQ